MNICRDFATNNFINFNAKKTICIKYGESVRLTEHVILDGNVISRYTVGNFFNSRHYINVDSNRKSSHFIGHYNHMMSNFVHLNPEIVFTLCKSYCCSFYG